MTYDEMIQNARNSMGGLCKACPVCNGKACGNTIPGPGAKGIGDVAIRNYDAWQKIRINMNTIAENRDVDPSFDFFGTKLKYPILAGPVGAVKLHYGEKYDDVAYNDILVKACRDSGIAAFTGDGTDPNVMKAACKAIKVNAGMGIPTVKPWDTETLKQKFELVKDSDSIAVAMDIDAAGLPFLQGLTPPAGSKTVLELAEIIKASGKPFIVKGIMTIRGALAALEAGASAIIVSNHGGRVLDQTPSTAEVLEEIVDAVGGRCKVFVDGGIRSGISIFKALAIGADAVVIARPYVTSVYGGGEEGVKLYTEKLGNELKDTMRMCGTATLGEISRENLFDPSSSFFTM